MLEQNLLTRLLHQERLARKAKPNDEEIRWGITRGRVTSYEQTFRNVLGENKFDDLLTERRRKGKSNLVADIMGYGWVLTELPIDYGLAVALTTLDFDRIQSRYRNIEMINGNIASKRVWNQIREWLVEKPASSPTILPVLQMN